MDAAQKLFEEYRKAREEGQTLHSDAHRMTQIHNQEKMDMDQKMKNNLDRQRLLREAVRRHVEEGVDPLIARMQIEEVDPDPLEYPVDGQLDMFVENKYSNTGNAVSFHLKNGSVYTLDDIYGSYNHSVRLMVSSGSGKQV